MSALGCCQTNSNQSQLVQLDCPLSRAKPAPLGESSGAVGLEIVAAVEMSFLVEVVVDRGMNGCEFLQNFASAGSEASPAPVVGMAGANSLPDC